MTLEEGAWWSGGDIDTTSRHDTSSSRIITLGSVKSQSIIRRRRFYIIIYWNSVKYSWGWNSHVFFPSRAYFLPYVCLNLNAISFGLSFQMKLRIERFSYACMPIILCSHGERACMFVPCSLQIHEYECTRWTAYMHVCLPNLHRVYCCIYVCHLTCKCIN